MMYNDYESNVNVAATCDLLVRHAVLCQWLLGHTDRPDSGADVWSPGGSHCNYLSQSCYHHLVIPFLHQAFYNTVSHFKYIF